MTNEEVRASLKAVQELDGTNEAAIFRRYLQARHDKLMAEFRTAKDDALPNLRARIVELEQAMSDMKPRLPKNDG